MRRLVFILLFGSACNGYGAATNVLWFILDDMRSIGGFSEGQPDNLLEIAIPNAVTRAAWTANMTPRLDSLSSNAVHFVNAYAPVPLCNPSRSSFLTGIRMWDREPTMRNTLFFRDSSDPILANAKTIPQWFRENGYWTFGTGKIFHLFTAPYPEIDDLNSFQAYLRRAITPTTSGQSVWSVGSYPIQFGPHAGGAAWTNHMEWVACNAVSNLLATGTVTVRDQQAAADETYTLPTGNPWMIVVGLYVPHSPHYVPQDILDLFPVGDLTGIDAAHLALVQADTNDLSATAFSTGNLGGGAIRGYWQQMLSDGLVTEPGTGDISAWRSFLRHYLADIAVADRLVDTVMDGLEAGGLDSNTVVIVSGDHGYQLGEKDHVGKRVSYDNAMKTLLMISDPDVTNGWGQTCSVPASLMDIYRTLTGAVGLSTPEQVGGMDLGPYLLSPASLDDRTVYGVVDGTYPVAMNRNGAYLLYTADGSDDEFYALDVDPLEYTNAIADGSMNSRRAFISEDLNRMTNAPDWFNDAPVMVRAGNRVGPR